MTSIALSALGAIVAFCIALAVAPLVFTVAKKLKLQQTVLHYVEQHSAKSGTPTMGGWIFLIASLTATLIFTQNRLAIMAVAVMLAYGIVGFLDDIIKVYFKQNEGLKPYQKIVAQLGIAIVVSLFVLKNENIGSAIILPFSEKTLALSWGIIPFTVFLFVALTNAVNLTDGLDGLAGWTGVVYLICFAVIVSLLAVGYEQENNPDRAEAMRSLAVFSAATTGGVLGFLCLNSYPAKIMMGDTGSLALGGALACIASFSAEPLLILFVGIMYVVSCISVIMQVVSFKLTGKRIFLMAPFHHHLEKLGWHEAKITAVYSIVTLIFGLLAIISVG